MNTALARDAINLGSENKGEAITISKGPGGFLFYVRDDLSVCGESVHGEGCIALCWWVLKNGLSEGEVLDLLTIVIDVL